MKRILKKIKSIARAVKYSTGYEGYKENNYGNYARITNEGYRNWLVSWQIPAIKKHCGDLTDKSFIDIGAGDIVLGEFLSEIGTPRVFYAQDLSEPSLKSGIKRINKTGAKMDIFVTLASDNFDFSKVPDSSLDYAFSNSLFSHLSINSILLCLRKLAPKMKVGGKYFSSMIVISGGDETQPYDWSYLERGGANIISYPTKDPYHYNEEFVATLSHFNTGFKVVTIHDYGHPFQKLVEFERV
jgi:hypothetical protein